MLEGFVAVGMLVPLGQVQPHTDRHQRAGRQQLSGDILAEQCHSQDSAEERGDGEVGTGAGRSQGAKPVDEQRQAHPVGGAPGEHGRGHHPGRRQHLAAHDQGQQQVHRSGNQALGHGQPGGVGVGHPAGEVVVHRPQQARCQHRQRRPQRAEVRPGARPAEHDRAGGDHGHAGCDAPVHVLPEDDPCQQCGEHGFGVQQQRRTGGRHRGQARHEQHRRHDAAGDDRPGEPAPVTGCEPYPRSPSGAAVQRQPEPRPRVQQAGQEPWVSPVQQQLRRRRGGAEEQGRGQRCQHSALP